MGTYGWVWFTPFGLAQGRLCHTFGRDLAFKPHVHLILTKGGLDKEGEWVAIDTIPGGRLAAIWRYLLCQRLRQRYPRLHPHITEHETLP